MTYWLLNWNEMIFSHFQVIGKAVNPYQANFPFLRPLKTSENLWFSDVFRGYSSDNITLHCGFDFESDLCIMASFLIFKKKKKKLCIKNSSSFNIPLVNNSKFSDVIMEKYRNVMIKGWHPYPNSYAWHHYKVWCRKGLRECC